VDGACVDGRLAGQWHDEDDASRVVQRVRLDEVAGREEHAAIAQLVPRAIDAGLTKREISRLTGVSRPWIDTILSRQA
jgi:hypothetical protein